MSALTTRTNAIISHTGVNFSGKEGYLLKLKRFADEEAVIVGVVEEMENQNEATINELGQTKRSTAKAGKVGKGRLGALRCQFEDGTEFEVGSGFDDEDRARLWAEAVEARRNGFNEGEAFQDRIVTVKHQPPPGGRKPGEAPRFPVFKGFRDD
jgi:DNA ligase-1